MRVLSPPAALWLSLAGWATGCANDFELRGQTEPVTAPDDTDDTTAVVPEDSDTPPDTTVTEEPPDTGVPPDTDEPIDTGVPPDTDEPVDTDPPPVDDCTETSDLIYVIARNDERLYTFDPSALTFTSVGVLDCTMWGETPGSMAIARDGVGYVRYSDDSVYAIDLTTADCSPTSYAPGSFGAFGMGYATDQAGSWRDKLYIANSDRLAVLDTTTWTRTLLGNLPSQSELTGNAQGELWAILPLETPAKIVQLDKDDGSTVSTINLSGFPSPSTIDTFAFAGWGSQFWVFVRTYGMGESTDVYEVGANGVLTRRLDNIGFDIVGAGVSTCAPAQ
jgi:hypothetical protein